MRQGIVPQQKIHYAETLRTYRHGHFVPVDGSTMEPTPNPHF